MGKQLLPFFQLLRPANIVTAFADILAGTAIAVSPFLMSQQARSSLWRTELPALPGEVILLLLATFGLYGGGVVLNDVFDAHLDATERPERPIPSGRVSRWSAALFGIVLLITGVVTALQVNTTAGVLACFIVICVVIYDSTAKHHTVLGPLFMGLCRSGNLLLGISLFPPMMNNYWFLCLLPLTYIFAITLISQGEVHGGSRWTGRFAVALVVAVIAGLLLPGLLPAFNPSVAAPFVGLFAWMILPAFVRAAKTPTPEQIKKAVKRGVLSLIILNSSLAAGFGGLLFGLLVLSLLPLSMLLGRAFSVT